MALPRPKNYNDIVRLKRCTTLHRTIPQLTPENIEQIYEFISRPSCSVTVSNGVLSLRDEKDVVVSTFTVPVTTAYNYILLSNTTLYIAHPAGSGGDGDGGSSGNNNNNNNNNNG